MTTRKRRAMGVFLAAILVAACEANLAFIDAPSLDAGTSPGADSSLSPATDAGPSSTPVQDASDASDATRTRTAAPTFTPAPGTYTSTFELKITAMPGATVHFTDDGTTPTETSPVYDSPRTVCGTVSVRALATAPGLDPSDVVSGTFVVDVPYGTSAPVSFNPPSGAYDAGLDVTLATPTSPVTICFSLDGGQLCGNFALSWCSDVDTMGRCHPGSLPYDAGSPIHVDPLLDVGAVTIRAQSCSGFEPPSDVTIATYSFEPPSDVTIATYSFAP